MTSTSGIRATGSDRGDYPRRALLKNAAGYVAWSTKMEQTLDAEDCWDIVTGTEVEPDEIGWVVDPGEEEQAPGVQIAAEAARALEIKDWKKRFKKAASLITQGVDDSLVRVLRVHNKNPILMWARLSADFNKVSPAQLSIARRDFQNYHIEEDESYLVSRQNFEDLIQEVTTQGGIVTESEQLLTLIGSLPEKLETIRDTFYAQTPEPDIEYVWSRLHDREVSQRRRDQSAAMRGEVYYQSGGRGGRTSRGRGSTRVGGGSSGRDKEVKNEGCFRCGEADHWSKECPKKDSVCTWCGATGHIEKTCYSKANGSARGGKTGGRGSRGRGRGGRGGGYGRLGEVEEEEEPEYGYSEALIGEVNMGTGDGDGDEKEWVCDSGADFHMSGDRSLFEFLVPIPATFFVKQIMGKVAVTEWGTIRLRTDGEDGSKKVLQLREVLFMPGMKVNIFSLQRIRSRGSCSYTFQGAPGSNVAIPILNKCGEQIATMRETKKARPTLICSRVKEAEVGECDLEAEVLGGKGIQMELLHRRLGHTSQSVIQRLVRDQMVRGLEEGVVGEYKMCRGCKMGRSSEQSHPRKSPEYRAKEPLELVHTDIAGPFEPVAIGGKGHKYNLLMIDDFSRKSWVVPLRRKSDTAAALKEWIVVRENEVGKKLKVLRSDNGGEFMDGALGKWYRERGIQHQTIPARSPQSNGVSERGNRTLQDRGRSMLIGAGLGGGFWVEAIAAASYIRNRGPVTGLSSTPDELWSGKKPTVKHLRAYGSKAYVSLEHQKRKGKMGETKWEGVIVGYPTSSIGYRVWDPSRGQVYTVGVPHIDEDVQPGWWRKTGGVTVNEEEEEIVFPDLVVGVGGGAAAGIQAGGLGVVQPVFGGGAGEPVAGAGAGQLEGRGAGVEAGEPGAGAGAGQLGGGRAGAGVGELGTGGCKDDRLLCKGIWEWNECKEV